MKKFIICLAVLGGHYFSFGQIHAITENGEEVLLYDDGTWKSAVELELPERPFDFPSPPFKGKVIGSNHKVNHTIYIENAASNSITDDQKWFEENELSLSSYSVPNSFRGIKGDVPNNTPTSYKGSMLISATYNDNYNFLVYGRNFSEGRYLVITNKDVSKVEYAFDFKEYMLSPDYIEKDRMFIDQSINWVDVQGDTLFISHGHRTYAESSKYMNAYITAISLSTNEVIWRTKPLMCNTQNFLIYEDMIVTGYGFTAEKDYMYTINKNTGGLSQKVPVKTGPNYIILKEGKLYVRTYDMDYIFGIK